MVIANYSILGLNKFIPIRISISIDRPFITSISYPLIVVSYSS